MTTDGVRKLLSTACDQVGGQRSFARLHNIDVGYISRVIGGGKEPGESICRALGIERVVTYSKKKARPND